MSTLILEIIIRIFSFLTILSVNMNEYVINSTLSHIILFKVNPSSHLACDNVFLLYFSRRKNLKWCNLDFFSHIKEHLTTGFGWLQLSQGFSVLIGMFLLGYIKNFYADYTLTFLVSGVLLFLAGLCLLPWPLVKQPDQAVNPEENQNQI